MELSGASAAQPWPSRDAFLDLVSQQPYIETFAVRPAGSFDEVVVINNN